jgi:hypothetical protein
MTEATGFEAKTIHQLLEVDPKSGGFKRDSDNQLDCDLLVGDLLDWAEQTILSVISSCGCSGPKATCLLGGLRSELWCLPI